MEGETSKTLDKYFKSLSPTHCEVIDEVKHKKKYQEEAEKTEPVSVSFADFMKNEICDEEVKTKDQERRKTKRKRQSDDVKVVKKARSNREKELSSSDDESITDRKSSNIGDCIILETATSFNEFTNQQKTEKCALKRRTKKKQTQFEKPAFRTNINTLLRFPKKSTKTSGRINSKKKTNSCKNSTTPSKTKLVCDNPKKKENVEEKRRKSSSDGVVYVADLKKATRRHMIPDSCRSPMKPKKPVCDLPALKNDCILWTEKYEPKSAEEITGNATNVKKLLSWLQEWKKRVERANKQLLKEAVKAEKMKVSKSRESSGSDFDDDCSDADGWLEEDDSLTTTAVIIGPTGCGKTAAVYACANQLNFKVFEMNSSSQRSSKQVLSQLHEATQSHLVSKNQQAFTDDGKPFFARSRDPPSRKSLPKVFAGFSKKKSIQISDDSKRPTNQPHSVTIEEKTSLILFEEADVIFEEDKFFWSAVQTLMVETKRPIIITTSDSNVLNNLEGRYEKFLFKHPTTEQLSSCLRRIGEAENCKFSEGNCQDLKLATDLVGCDMRRLIHSVHFWGCNAPVEDTGCEKLDLNGMDTSIISISSQTDTDGVVEGNFELKKRKQRKRGKRKSKTKLLEKTVQSSNHDFAEKNFPMHLDRLFDSICGTNAAMANTIIDIKTNSKNSLEYSEASDSSLLNMFQKLSSHPDNSVYNKLIESSLSHLHCFNLPNIITLNWQTFLPHTSYAKFPIVGKVPLKIHLPASCLSSSSTDQNFSLMNGVPNDYFSLVEGSQEPIPQVPADFLIEEDSMDVCYVNGRSTMQSADSKDLKQTEILAKSANVATKSTNKLNDSISKTLAQLSIMADVCSMSDQLQSTYMQFTAADEREIDLTVCRIKDSSLDELGNQVELSHQSRSTAADIQACIQTMSLTQCITRIKNIAQQEDFTALSSDTIILRLPYEAKARKYNQYLRQSMQSMLIGGNFTPRTSFNLDYLPTLRSICRAEIRRKEAKARRRFLHYLNTIHLHPKTSEFLRMERDFEEKVESELTN